MMSIHPPLLTKLPLLRVVNSESMFKIVKGRCSVRGFQVGKNVVYFLYKDKRIIMESKNLEFILLQLEIAIRG